MYKNKINYKLLNFLILMGLLYICVTNIGTWFQIFSKIDANINGVKIIDRGNNTVYEMQCFVRNLEHLEKVLLELNKKPYINNIERLMQ